LLVAGVPATFYDHVSRFFLSPSPTPQARSWVAFPFRLSPVWGIKTFGGIYVTTVLLLSSPATESLEFLREKEGIADHQPFCPANFPVMEQYIF
jgi:hypothetical protein